LDRIALEKVVSQYLFTEQPPMRDEVIAIMDEKPKLRERKNVAERVIDKIKDYVATFVDGRD
jgi:type I restriction enzyme R subunit